MARSFVIGCEGQLVDQTLITKQPETALKYLIAQQTAGQDGSQYLHSIVRAIIPKNDNSLKRLLYYYMEALGDDKSLIVCMNMVSQDLSSPNEYVRGVALRFVARLDNYDFVTLLIRGVRDNLSNKMAYVRMNAIHCLVELACRFDIDIEEELRLILGSEVNPDVLCLIYRSMERLGMDLDEYMRMDNHPDGVLIFFLEHSDDRDFMARALPHSSISVAYKAALRLLSLRARESEAETNMCMEIVLKKLKECPECRHDFIPYIPLIQQDALEFLYLLDPYELEFSRRLIEQVLETAQTHEFVRVAEILHDCYQKTLPSSGKKSQFRLMLLDSMASFSRSHCVMKQDMVGICIKNVLSDDIELVYASLRFLETISEERSVIDFLIDKFAQLQQGKILRLVFDIITKNVTKDQFEKLTDKLVEKLDNSDISFLQNPEVFNGTHICLSLVMAYRPEWDLKAKTLALLIRFLNIDKITKKVDEEDDAFGTNMLDMSSRSTISICIRSMLAGVQLSSSNRLPLSEEKKTDVLAPLLFRMFRSPVFFPKFEWASLSDRRQSTVQLSGLGDPLYVETTIFYNKHELVLDILVINQTDYYLQEIFLDFISSKHLSLSAHSWTNGLSLQKHSATTFKVSFSIQEAASHFISASASFKFPKNEQYASIFVQNLSDITVGISNFLEPVGSINFREHWKEMDWENIRPTTITNRGNTQLDDLLDRVVVAVHGTVCGREKFVNFLVANIAAQTIRNTPVLINLCISQKEQTTIEMRVRSKDDEIVKCVMDRIVLALDSQ